MHSDFALIYALLIAQISALTPPNTSKRYRTDYVYNEETNAFYKLHVDIATKNRADAVCVTEGAKLMVVTSQADIGQLHSMFKKYPDLCNFVWVADDGAVHESAEEQPIIDLSPADEDIRAAPLSKRCDVITRRGEVESLSCFSPLPFICKVDAKDAPYDINCDIYGTDYVYYESIGSCYKATRVALTWEEGYEECRAEGAHLVVVNSEAERLAVWQVMRSAPSASNAHAHWFFFAGFRADSTRVFKTIFNQTLEEAGCVAWGPHEPNNARNIEACGSLYKNDGNFNDLNCHHRYASICEKEVPKKQS